MAMTTKTVTKTTIICDLCRRQAAADKFDFAVTWVTVYDAGPEGRLDICAQCFAKPIAELVEVLASRHQERARQADHEQMIKDMK
jgi:hypothetical protein